MYSYKWGISIDRKTPTVMEPGRRWTVGHFRGFTPDLNFI